MIKKISQRLISTQFLSLLMIKMLIPAMATGGIAIEVGANNQLQSAFINSVTPVEVSVGEAAEVCGNVINSDSAVMACGYEPSLAVALSATTSFKLLPSSPAANTVFFMEQTWSQQADVKLPDLTII